MSEDKQVNTQQAEGNSETNPSTQADKMMCLMVDFKK